jgi:L-asparaginase / beta-aspartyl-peptidase
MEVGTMANKVALVHGLAAAMLVAGVAWTAGSEEAPARWTIVIHGGAGADPNEISRPDRVATESRLQSVLRRGRQRLADGAAGIDVVEEAIVSLEDDPVFNAGRGAALNTDGEAELDAAVMQGGTLACGAVAGVRRAKNPIRLARKVMESTPHVLLVGPGADRFAGESGLEVALPEYFVTARAKAALHKKMKPSRGTVGCVVLDRQGNLTAGTSTGGLTGKRPGRVGDSPVIGAGTYADNRSCAVSCTGTGEEFIRHNVAAQISWRMRLQPCSLGQAVEGVYRESLPPDVGGVIAVDREGNYVMHYNTPGMSRGVADSKGTFEYGIGKIR